jgi:dihydroorotase
MTGELGTLAPGAAADVTLLRLAEGEWPFIDSTGAVETGRQRLEPVSVVRAGQLHPCTPSTYAPVPHVH